MTTKFVPNVPIIISDIEPSIPSSSGFSVTDWKWFNVTNQRWYDQEDGWVIEGEEPVDYALLNHSHPTHGDINFTGTVSADGDEGLTGTRTLAGYKFTFKKGLLTGFEPV